MAMNQSGALGVAWMMVLAGAPLVVQAQGQARAPEQATGWQQSAASTLSEVRVVEEQGDAGYAPAVAQTAATRTEVPLIETPQSVQVVSRELMDDMGAEQLDDVVDLVSGVTRQNDFGGTWDNYSVRGFSNADGGFLLNGFASSRGYGVRRDAVSVERVEFLKGPAAALYGSSEPGGTINVVTKKPKFRPEHVFGLQVGTKGLARTTLDTTGPLSQTVAYRLNVAAEDGASRTKRADNERYVVAPALTWAIDADTTLNYEAEFIRIRRPLDRGIIQVGGNPGVLPVDRYLGEPSRPNLHVDGDTHQLTLDRALNRDWRLRLGASHRETDLEGHAIDLIGALRPDNRTLTRRDSWRSLPARDTSLQAEVTGHFQTAGIGHTLLAGVESWRLATMQEIYYSTIANESFAIDIYEPVYGAAPGMLTRSSHQRDVIRATGGFVQDQLSLSDHWKVLAGVRSDHFRQDYENWLRGSSQHQRHSAFTPRVGVTYMLSADSSLYLSWGRSFKPNTGADAQGHAFEPMKGTAWELGMKWQSPDQRLQASVAAFNIEKGNILTADPNDPDYNVATGKVRSRGLEVDVAGQLDRHWRLTANVALADTKVTRDNNAARLGKRLAGVPRLSAAVFALREDTLPNGSRYGLGGGVVHVGKRTANDNDTWRLPGYTSVRLNGYWQVDPRVRLTLEVRNLFDKDHYLAAWRGLIVVPGLGRQVVAGVQWRL